MPLARSLSLALGCALAALIAAPLRAQTSSSGGPTLELSIGAGPRLAERRYDGDVGTIGLTAAVPLASRARLRLLGVLDAAASAALASGDVLYDCPPSPAECASPPGIVSLVRVGVGLGVEAGRAGGFTLRATAAPGWFDAENNAGGARGLALSGALVAGAPLPGPWALTLGGAASHYPRFADDYRLTSVAFTLGVRYGR